MQLDPGSDLKNFGGVARLFPLPNLVLFPNLLQGLHIFEPRYRQMTAEALASDRLIALVLLQPGWEAEYEGNPALHRVACLGKIVADEKLGDGRYNLRLQGLSRVRIVREIDDSKPYRSAEVKLLADIQIASADRERFLHRALKEEVTAWYAKRGPVLEIFTRLLKSDLPLGTVADIVSFALPLDVARKQKLLETMTVSRRVLRLVRYLRELSSSPAAVQSERIFPPEFSNN